MLDLLLKGGLVFDGTGAPPTRADVGIAGVAGLVVGALLMALLRRRPRT